MALYFTLWSPGAKGQSSYGSAVRLLSMQAKSSLGEAGCAADLAWLAAGEVGARVGGSDIARSSDSSITVRRQWHETRRLQEGGWSS